MNGTFTRTVSTLAAAGALALGSVAVSAPADAAPVHSRITAHASDSTVQAGQSFNVRGRFALTTNPPSSRLVKIQTLLGGTWQQIAGAQVRTTNIGTYRVRLDLSLTGTRTLRAVGVTPGPAANAYKRFTVRVR